MDRKIEDYYELYQIAARKLKAQFPDILIGASTEASVTEENLQAMLDGIQSDGQETPLDFVGWHLYTNDPGEFPYRARLVRKILNQNGYEATQTYLDEWNFVKSWD